MDILDIYRNGAVFVSIKPDDSSVQSKTIMAENEVRLQFRLNNYVNFSINDYCTVYSEIYILNRPPVVRKISTYLYEYNLVMEARGFELARAQFLFLDPNNNFTQSDFSFTGNADAFIELVLDNVARVGTGWTKGTVLSTEYKTLTFSKENCYNVLARLAEAFDTEFWVIGKTIHIFPRSKDTGFTFKHGRGKGLYEITRQNLNNSDIATRLYAFGSQKNLPPDYGYLRLVMPFGNPTLVSNVTWGILSAGPGIVTITFDWTAPSDPAATAVQIEYRISGSTGAYTTVSGSVASPRSVTLEIDVYEFRFRTMGASGSLGVTPGINVGGVINVNPVLVSRIAYVERNVDLYGVIEATQFFDDIFPHRTGTVTAVDAGDIYKFTDVDIDFDVIEQLMPGLDARITFNTGQLAGYSFKINSFDYSTKVFRILKNDEEKALDVPNPLIKPAIGDQYVITDIRMPDSYVAAAEQELLAQATLAIAQASQPQVTYTVVIDPVYLRSINQTFNIGDLVWIVDNPMEIQRKIRIVNTTRALLNEFQYTVQLSDVVTPTTINRIINSVSTTDRSVNDLQNQVNNNSILNNRVIGPFYMLQLPETSDLTGYSELVIEDATGIVHKKV
jgi:hypothetical protein